MESTVRLALVGDYDAERPAHAALEDALRHSLGTHHRAVAWEWVHTRILAIEPVSALAGANALVVATDDDCASIEGALAGIRFARERGIPCLCVGGAFGHAVAEFTRNVLGGISGAPGIGASDPDAAANTRPRRRSGAFFLETASRTAAVYGRWRAVEESPEHQAFNDALRAPLASAGFRVTGTDSSGQPTVLELDAHPFFIAAQFEPQLGSRPLAPAPLVRAVVDAAIHHCDRRGTPHGLAASAG
jgi:CTP synthase (UTP-ammonia lyase)